MPKRKQSVDIGSFFKKRGTSVSSTGGGHELLGDDIGSKSCGTSQQTNVQMEATTEKQMEATTEKPNVVQKFQQEWLKKNKWLQYDEEKNLMFCDLCRAGDKDNIMAVGTDNFRTSTLTRHVSHPDHQLLIAAKSMEKSTRIVFDRTFELETKAVVTAMKAVYYLAKENLPLDKYPSLIKLFRDVKAEYIQYLIGGEKTNYESTYAAAEFLEAISDYFVEKTNEKLQSASVISILCDESTDVVTHKKLSIWARVINVNITEVKPETIFLSDLFLTKGNGETIVETLKTDLSQRGISMSKVMGLGTDSATVMTGTNKGVTGLLLRENPLIVNVHCLAHRVALVTSQAAQNLPVLKDFQQTLTNLFYYFSKSSNKVQTLEEIQTILEMPILKIREIHEVRWLSFFEALMSVYRCFPALLTYFEAVKNQKDPKGEGIARKLVTRKFIYLTCMMLGMLAPVMILSQKFQKQDLNPSMVSVHIEACKADLLKVKDGSLPGYLSTLKTDINEKEKTYQGYKIDMSPSPTATLSKFVDALTENINSRFPQMDILNAFGVLAMRPISQVSKDELGHWGDDQMNILTKHFGQPKEHKWKEGSEIKVKVADPLINPDETMREWVLCKLTVLSQLYPRDNMILLWQTSIQFHKQEFPNLIKLAAVALTCPTNTADCERSFSVQNYITCQRRASISPNKCDQLMRICICGPNLSNMQFEDVVSIWKKKKHRLLYSKKKQSH